MHVGIRLAALCVFVLVLLPLQAQGASWTDSPRALVLLEETAPGGMKDFVRLLETEGGHASVILSPRAAVVIASDELFARPAFAGWILEASNEAIELDRVSTSPGEIVNLPQGFGRSSSTCVEPHRRRRIRMRIRCP